MAMIPYNFKITQILLERLRICAAHDHRTTSQMLRVILEEYLTRRGIPQNPRKRTNLK